MTKKGPTDVVEDAEKMAEKMLKSETRRVPKAKKSERAPTLPLIVALLSALPIMLMAGRYLGYRDGLRDAASKTAPPTIAVDERIAALDEQIAVLDHGLDEFQRAAIEANAKNGLDTCLQGYKTSDQELKTCESNQAAQALTIVSLSSACVDEGMRVPRYDSEVTLKCRHPNQHLTLQSWDGMMYALCNCIPPSITKP